MAIRSYLRPFGIGVQPPVDGMPLACSFIFHRVRVFTVIVTMRNAAGGTTGFNIFNTKSFYYIQIKGVRLNDYRRSLDRHMCDEVGQRREHIPTNASIRQQRQGRLSTLELAWGSYVHKIPNINPKNKGTVHMFCIFTKRKGITVDQVEWWVSEFIVHDITNGNITVTWGSPGSLGLQGERDIYAAGRTIRENNPPLQPDVGLRDRAINNQRNRLAHIGDPGTLLETDGRWVTDRVRGGDLNGFYTGGLWSRDQLARKGDFPILIPDQVPLANDVTRGIPTFNEYRTHRTTTIQQGQALLEYIVDDIRTYANDNAVSREECGNREHLGRQAIQWKLDGGEDGVLVEATVTCRRENNRNEWGSIEWYIPDLPHPNVPVDSSIDA